MNILGVKIDNLSQEEILNKINIFLAEPKFHQIATINPEFILRAEKNTEFKNILNGCDLNVADGIGVWFAALWQGKILKSRFTGIDLMLEILKIANDKGLNIFLAARNDGLSTWEETRDAIHKIYPNLNISGENIDINSVIASKARQSMATKRSFAFAQDDKYDIVFVNFGAPHQEIFINSVKSDTPPHLCQNNESISNFRLRNERCGGKIRLAMGVGGSFDFLTGKIKRAPSFLRMFGLEWLWRLALEPRYRWKRIINSVIVFPWKVI